MLSFVTNFIVFEIDTLYIYLIYMRYYKMTAVNGVRTTENLYTTGTPSAQASGSSYVNSVMTAAQDGKNTSVEGNEVQNTSKLDELLEKMCAELKIKLDPQELKSSGILYRISGLNAEQISKLSEAELKQIVECLKTAIKDSAVDGKVDLEKVGSLANDYYIAVKTGWTIEGFKSKNKTSHESLSERIERFFGLDKKGIKFTDLPPEKIEEYLIRYFNDFFIDKIKKASPAEKEKIYKEQLQDFGKLLINTDDKDKSIFKQAILSLVASNRVKGLDAVLASFDTPAARTAWADSWTVEERKDFALKTDVEGNIPSSEDVVAGNAKLTAVQSEEGRKKSHDEFQADAKAFFKENAEIITRIAEKEANGEELTDEEKVVKHQIEHYYTPTSSGEFIGTAMNEIIGEAFKKEMLAEMNKDAYELPNYKDVIEQALNYIEEHPEVLTLPKEELTMILDEATNGNFSIIAENSDAPLNPPAATPETVSASADNVSEDTAPAYGYTMPAAAPDNTNLLAIQNEIFNQTIEEETNFTVETEAPQTEEKLTSSEIYTLKSKAYRSAANIKEYLTQTGESKFKFATDVFKKYSEMGHSTQEWAMNYFSNASNTMQKLFLDNIVNFREGMVAAAKEVDMSRFNLPGISVSTQKQVDRIQEQRGLI